MKPKPKPKKSNSKLALAALSAQAVELSAEVVSLEAALDMANREQRDAQDQRANIRAEEASRDKNHRHQIEAAAKQVSG